MTAKVSACFVRTTNSPSPAIHVPDKLARHLRYNLSKLLQADQCEFRSGLSCAVNIMLLHRSGTRTFLMHAQQRL